MGYQNGAKVLPLPLLKKVQQYVQGECIYIPRTQLHTRRTDPSIQMRNEEIFRLRSEGWTVKQLSEAFYLSPQAIYKVLAQGKK